MPLPRRQFLTQSATFTTAWALAPRLTANSSTKAASFPAHPRLFISATGANGLQTVEDFRQGIKAGGWLGENWTKTLAQARTEAKLPPLQPNSAVPDRAQSAIRDRNLDYYICAAAGSRLNRFALAHLVTGDEACHSAALAQLEAILDPDQWPDWIDQSHLRFGHPADLRTGMLSQDAGIAYDWLHDSLNEQQRARIREGIDRRGIQPFLTSVAQNAWWTNDLNNWVTVIAGGVAVAAMSLLGEHPQAQQIVDYATNKFEDYLDTYGPDGEFNESVGYSGANRIPVGYFVALRYATGGTQNRLASFPFPEMCSWVRQATLDHKRGIPFGDSWPLHPVRTGYTAAVAAANQDGGLQHYFMATQLEEDPHPTELLFFDARLKPIPPTGHVPLAVAYTAHGGMIVSRTSWDQPLTECIVFSKFGREENHEHNDLGQVGFDTLGERLIIDLGSPSSYPEDFFEPHIRWKYYNASVQGHNLLMFGGREQRYQIRDRGEAHHILHLSGKLTHWWHQAGQGTAWQMDLTPAYTGATRVTRTVLHLWPGYILVLDEADLDKTEPISLRWHTIDQATPSPSGTFTVLNENTAATGRIASLTNQALVLNRREHGYVEPYHLERSGDPLQQRHESYIEAETTAASCRILTLFATGPKAPFGGSTQWHQSSSGWTFVGPEGPVHASVSPSVISLTLPSQNRTVSIASRGER